ncbi:hypothetical protein VCHC41A1_2904, partial [Vibrio cholerae HC-41A1]
MYARLTYALHRLI